MGKRGRKRKGYFYEEQEQAVVDYIVCQDITEKNQIFDTLLLPAFTKMIESIIRRYKLYVPDEDFEQTFDDTISFLMTKIEKFNPNRGFKAYSYCGTICKNYLLYKLNSFRKHQEKQESYDDMYEVIRENDKYSENTFGDFDGGDFLSNLISNTCSEIQKIIDDKDNVALNNDEIRVGLALIDLFQNWEEVFGSMGSNKMNKSLILLYLKETTQLSTPEIRKSMKKYKIAYFDLKKKMLEM